MLYFDIAITLGYPTSCQGHLKVTARSNQLKKAENILFSIITFTSDNKAISRSQQGQIIYKKLVIIACFTAFATIMFTSDFAKTLG